MSYDIHLTEPETKKVIYLDDKHDIGGGTYAMGGTNEAWLNITYNYSTHFSGIGPKGIRSLYGKTGLETIPILEKVISQLGDDVDKDYWKATEGNAKKALLGLLTFAKIRPDGIWDGD